MKVKLHFFRHRPLVDIFNNKKYITITPNSIKVYTNEVPFLLSSLQRERFLALKSVPSPSPALRHAKVGLLAEGGDIWFGWQHSGSPFVWQWNTRCNCFNKIVGGNLECTPEAFREPILFRLKKKNHSSLATHCLWQAFFSRWSHHLMSIKMCYLNFLHKMKGLLKWNIIFKTQRININYNWNLNCIRNSFRYTSSHLSIKNTLPLFLSQELTCKSICYFQKLN